MRRPQRRYQLPPLVSHPLDDLWSVVVSIARTNLVTNPSFETNTTNWAAIGGAIARTTTYQYHGAYSLAVTPVAFTDDGVQYGTAAALALTAGTAYAYSCKFRGQAGLKYELVMVSTLFVVLARKRFVATGRWQWVTGVYVEGSTATAYLVVRKDGQANLTPFYVDGVQVEACAADEVFPTTYIDGDQVGLVSNQSPPAYLWNGTPHGSTSSRSGLTRAGGRVVKFKDFGWLLTAIIGLGLAVPQHRITEYAALDGGNDNGTRKPTRQFTLVGQFAANTYGRLRENRGDLAALLDRDLIGMDQRLKLRYQAMRGCDLVGEEAEVICKYAGGLEGNTDGHFGNTAPITFTNYLPVVLSPGDAGAGLTVNQTVNNANRILLRSATGNWSAIGTGAAGGNVYAIAQGLDGAYYIGGAFTSFGGVANTLAIVKYDPLTGTISAMGTGAGSGLVNDIQIAPNGDVWVIGNFANMGGVAAADYVARWDGSAWNAVGTPDAIPSVTGPMQAAFGNDGQFYYPTYSNLTIKRWDGSAWSTIGTITGDLALSCVRGPDGNIYVGGIITAIGAVTISNAAKWNVVSSSWSAVAGTAPSAIQGLLFGENGQLYATLFEMTDSALAVNNGTGWTKLDSINKNGPVASSFSLARGPSGSGVYVGGNFTHANGTALPDSVGLWNNSVLIPLDANLPGTAIVYAIRSFRDGSLAVGYSTSGAATAAGITTVTNIGTAKAYPTLVMKYPSVGTTRVYQIVNITTGRAIYLNLTMNLGETVTMQFDPDNLSFVSDFVGNIASAILPGSNEADFFLQPGDNIISFFTEGGTLTATLQWRPAYLSLDDC